MASQQKAMGRVKRKRKACPKLLVVFSSGVEIDRPGADRNDRYREPDDAQRANGKKSDSKPEERISKRHSLPPGVRRRSAESMSP